MINNHDIEAAYVNYKNMMMSHAIDQIGDLMTSEDIVQDVFVRVIEKKDEVEGATIKAFIMKLLSDTIKDYQKKSKEVLILDLI